MQDGTVMRFAGQGNHPNNRLVGDLVITIREEKHESIRRMGDNLIYRHKISLADALTITVIDFTTLDE